MLTDESLNEFIEDCLKNFSERPAVTCLKHTLLYRELDELASAFAAYLQYDLGLKPGDKLAIQLPNLLQYPVAVLAAIKAGVVIVNTNPLYTEKELLYQYNDTEVKVVLVLSNMVENLARIIDKTSIEHVVVTQTGDLLPPAKRFVVNSLFSIKELLSSKPRFKKSSKFLFALSAGKGKTLKSTSTSPQSLALLQYTGGTTGISKGAMLTHANLLSNLRQINASVGGDVVEGEEIMVSPLPLYHIFSFMAGFMLGFAIGAQIILIPNPRNTKSLVAEIKGVPFSIFIGLNTLFSNLCESAGFQKLDFSHHRITISGGMALLESTAEAWCKITHCKILEGYGLTEASPVISLNPYEAPRLGTAGKFLIDTERRFIDVNGNTVEIGGIGELLVRGPQVMAKYWRQSAETSGIIDNEGWLHTGDVAFEDDEGYLHLVDRVKDMIIVSGFNVYPSELEDEIGKHPDVLECAVVAVADAKTVEAIKAFVVTSNPKLSAEDVQAFAHKAVASYKVPKYIEFVDTLPKTNVGKVLRRELRVR